MSFKIYFLLLILPIIIRPLDCAAEELTKNQTNYVTLQNKCQAAAEPGCCVSSVKTMKAGNFAKSEDGNCPLGQKKNMLKCESSLSWCEPEQAGDIAVNGKGIGKFERRFQKRDKASRGRTKPSVRSINK